jgi:hypothetical protein
VFENHDKVQQKRDGTNLRLQCPGDAWEACRKAHLRSSKRTAWRSLSADERSGISEESFDTPKLLEEREMLHIGHELLKSVAANLNKGVATMNPEPECQGITSPLKPTDTSLLISVTKELTDKFKDLTEDEEAKIGNRHLRLKSTLRMKPPPEMAAGAAAKVAAKPPTNDAQDRRDAAGTPQTGRRLRRQPRQIYVPSSTTKPSAGQVISCACFVCTVSNRRVSREARCRLLQIKLAIWTLGYTD